ncbi:MAG: HD domain-containing protein [Methanobrevibacter sp.]|jgi:putative hydrolase of HD superfamily|nr:HD domain-containing protein [Candidatus Methanovirga aequatorialis]
MGNGFIETSDGNVKMERIIELFFKAANMQRWNDHIRPVNLVELDKQAHKIVISYIIAKTEECENREINWIDLIDRFLFDFFYRIVLTDLKPPIFHKMMDKKEKELNRYVLSVVEPKLNDFDPDFADKFKDYVNSNKNSFEDDILKASHYIATNWEFKIVYNSAPFIYGIDKTKEDIEKRIEDHFDLKGVQRIFWDRRLHGFIDLCGQLRFQKRWAYIPRVPETSVLGHMLMVAIISYLFSMNSIKNPCNKRLYNNFFGGLFHDLPEVLTKDIISPIKKSVEGLDELIKEYEIYQMENEILPLIPETWGKELKYLTEDEFDNKILEKGKAKKVSSTGEFNEDKYSPVDGELIEVADKLSAYMEAIISIRHGVRSKELENASEEIKKEFSSKKIPNLDVNSIYENMEKIIKE